MRLFIAIDLPKSFKAELSRLQRELKAVSTGGRFVPESSFHITLHFIGESNALSEAASAMAEAVRGIRPFTLHLGEYDSFLRGSRTSFIKVLGELSELSILHEALQCTLFDAGFSRERKGLTPHITLGRSVEHDMAAQEAMLRLSPNASMTVDSIVLFESRKENGRIVYIPVHRQRF
ncbi:MAG: RNA 2',3'-cyclic phosphodiesterase [Clostridia bacterium]